MSQSIIRRLFETRLKNYAIGVPLKVAYQNAHFDPPNSTYLSCYIIPNQVDSDDLEGVHRSYSGIFQVSIHATKDNGPGEAEAIAEALQVRFPNNLRLTESGFVVQQVRPMSISPAIVEPDRYTLALSCSYRADTV